MVTEVDIWRSAPQIVDQFGDAAPNECAKRANQFFGRSDFAGYAVWVKIRAAAIELLNEEPQGPVH